MTQAKRRARQLLHHATALTQRFLKNEDGSLVPAIAGGALMLTGAAGLSIDGARMFYVKDVLQKSLDSAGLAAGHAMEVDTMEADAAEFFAANIASTGGVASATDMDIVISDDNEVITLTASATVQVTFMSLFGIDEVTVTANTEITRETRGMELVLVMDNTGSMRNDDKIDTMKEAATNLVNIVYGDDETSTNLWVGVVPYITQVNVGTGAYNWLSDTGKDRVDNDYLNTTWKGCVEARSGGEDLTDAPPSIAPFEPYYWQDTDPFDALVWKYSWWSGWYQVEEEVDEDNNWYDDGSGTTTINEVNNSSTALGPNKGCGPQVTPLVAEKSKITAAIEEMAPWSFGGTAANLGLAWGWRVVSPSWRGLWSGSPAELPLDHDTPFMDKVIVMLTDGKNEFIENDYSELGYSDYTAFGRLADLGYDNKEDGRDDMDDRFDEICSNIKEDDIIIYTITFGTTPDEDTQDAYSACATNPTFYFHAPTAASLQEAFEKIGKNLSKLRLSK